MQYLLQLGMLIGPKIQQIREAKFVSEEKICQFLGISIQTYAAFENGERSISCGLLFKITNFLEIDPNEILNAIKEKSEEEYLICQANFILAKAENALWKNRILLGQQKRQ